MTNVLKNLLKQTVMRESEGSAKLVGEDSALPKFVTAVPFAPVYKMDALQVRYAVQVNFAT